MSCNAEDITYSKFCNVICLEDISLNVTDFIDLFYYQDHCHFGMNPLKQESDYINLKKRMYQGKRLNLVKEVLAFYAKDMCVDVSMLDLTSTMNIKRKLMNMTTFKRFCFKGGVMTLKQLFEQVVLETTQEEPITVDDIAGTQENPVYHTFSIYICIPNENCLIKDVLLKHNYVVKCSGEQIVKKITDTLL